MAASACNVRYGQHPLELPVIEGSFHELTLDAINQGLIDNPQNTELLKRKVGLLASANWPTGSLAAIEAALTEVDDDGELHYYASDYYYKKNQLVNAQKHGHEASLYGFLTADYFELYAEILLDLNEFDEAIIQARRFESLDPENYRSYLLQGKVLAERGDTTQAIDAYKKSFKLQQFDPDLNLELLNLYLSVRDTIGSMNIQKYLPDTPPDWQIQKAKLKLKHGLTNEAIYDLQAIVLKNSINIESRSLLGELLFQQESYDSAILLALETLEIDSLLLDMRLLAARSYDKRYNYQSSISHYQTLLAIDSTYENARSELDLVLRKVTYLRRLKEEQQSIPEFDLAPRRRQQVDVNNNLDE